MFTFIVHFMATLFMTGLIWFVQVVHYPLYSHVGSACFQSYQSNHVKWTGFVVGPVMLVEALSGIALLFQPQDQVSFWGLLTGLILLFGIWLSTALLQVPVHTHFRSKFDPQIHKRLVNTNWLRTTSWTFRSLLLAYVLSLHLTGVQ